MKSPGSSLTSSSLSYPDKLIVSPVIKERRKVYKCKKVKLPTLGSGQHLLVQIS